MGITREFTVAQRGIGLPDYAVRKPLGQVPSGLVYTSTDVGELAARLGSIVTFDRRGNVIWLDDFEGRLRWARAGGSAVISPDYSRNGDFSLKLDVEDSMYVSLLHNICFPVRAKFGFEISFAYDEDLEYFLIELDTSDGNYYYDASIMWSQASKKCQYLDENNVMQDLSPTILLERSLFTVEHSARFNTVKLVVDLVTHEYVRLMFNNIIFDLSGKGMRRHTPTAPLPVASSWIEPYILFQSSVADGVAYIDDAIITQNEPPNV